ncbi:hypothetical protein LSAT2_008391, partial [Lamellibrachia satsuma]
KRRRAGVPHPDDVEAGGRLLSDTDSDDLPNYRPASSGTTPAAGGRLLSDIDSDLRDYRPTSSGTTPAAGGRLLSDIDSDLRDYRPASSGPTPAYPDTSSREDNDEGRVADVEAARPNTPTCGAGVTGRIRCFFARMKMCIWSTSGSSSKTGKPDESSKSGKPGTSSKTGKPGKSSKTGKPGKSSKTGKPGKSSKTGKPGNTGDIVMSGAPENRSTFCFDLFSYLLLFS